MTNWKNDDRWRVHELAEKAGQMLRPLPGKKADFLVDFNEPSGLWTLHVAKFITAPIAVAETDEETLRNVLGGLLIKVEQMAHAIRQIVPPEINQQPKELTDER